MIFPELAVGRGPLAKDFFPREVLRLFDLWVTAPPSAGIYACVAVCRGTAGPEKAALKKGRAIPKSATFGHNLSNLCQQCHILFQALRSGRIS